MQKEGKEIKIEIFNKNFRDKNMNEKNFNIKIAVIGGLAGIMCGLFGTGGGMILVPAFIYMLDIEPKKARATSLCCMLAMVIASSFFYYKKTAKKILNSMNKNFLNIRVLFYSDEAEFITKKN